ncbi:hypothetical protein N1851_028847 [Merluccius polli]|uniref:Uncharacterized protein n=1 Tax=Merluccius polli TaxID=89951 RepID=A0AA47M7X8_MERPO|nr:hypothetical protein N1851_028847 [Merluccius polli]
MSALSRTRGDKWSQPGWRIEQKYTNKVLIGNWVEERLKFHREVQTASSTYCLDYQPQWESRPDGSVRRACQQRAEGLPSTQFFSHHATPASHYLVTLYDESYGRRDSAPPGRRTWHHDSLTWRPERSDHPVAAPPTNFGLLASRKPSGVDGPTPPPPAWLPSLSESRSTYQNCPPSALSQGRRARAPRLLSGRLHAPNGADNDLRLGQPLPLPAVPDGRCSVPAALWTHPPPGHARTHAGHQGGPGGRTQRSHIQRANEHNTTAHCLWSIRGHSVTIPISPSAGEEESVSWLDTGLYGLLIGEGKDKGE